MLQSESTDKPHQISVDVDKANDAESEGQTTPTPSKKLNANAMEFVPGKYISSGATGEGSSSSTMPNPAAPVFTPQFQMTPNGYMAMPAYAVPYYMYVPNQGGATNPDGTVSVSPVTTYQPTGYRGKGGLARHSSNGSNPSRGGKGSPYNPKSPVKPTPEPVAEPAAPVIKPEDFPTTLGAPIEEKEDKPTVSWAAIAKKTVTTPKTTVAPEIAVTEEPSSPVEEVVVHIEPTPVVAPTPSDSPLTLPLPSDSSAISVAGKASSVRSEPPCEPTPQTIPVSGKTKLAPWARVINSDEEVITPKMTKAEEVVEESITSVVFEEPSSRVYSLSFLKKLRFHESCRPSVEIRGLLPQTLLRVSGTSAEEADDWRAEAAATKLTRSQSSKKRSKIEISPDMLIPSENSWSVAQQKNDSQLDENVKVGRKIFSVLNKLTIEKFKKLADQLFNDCGISKPAHIITLVKYLFEKATGQHNFIPMYADLCNQCLEWLSSDAAPQELIDSIGGEERTSAAANIFRRVLLERCQEAFYSYFLEQEKESSPTEGGEIPPEEEEEKRQKHRLSMLGTVKFVAQLLERRLMTRAVFRNCIETLLYSDERTEDHIDCACVFIGEIGVLFDNVDADGEPVDQYARSLIEAIETLVEIADDETTSARIRFAILNLVDLRSNGYQAEGMRSVAQSTGCPSKISDIHKQVAKEQHESLQRTFSKANNASNPSLAPTVEEWETVPKRAPSAPWKTKRGVSE
jgi:hypothetical protein